MSTILEPEKPKSREFVAKEWKVICLFEKPTPDELRLCDEPGTAATYWENVIAKNPTFNPDVESLYVLHLNCRRRITGHHLVAQGLADQLLAHPREIFRTAIVANAAAIILMHNHPSGESTPSDADVKVTRDIIRAGQLLKIELLDHVIVGMKSVSNARGFHSLRELGYFFA